MKKHKIGMIGCGNIAAKHIIAMAENGNKIELSALCDIYNGKINDIAAYYSTLSGNNPESIKKYNNYNKILEDEEIEIVTITTSSGTRSRIALEALEAGKHLILEKPMALSIKDADAIIKKAEEKRLIVSVCHQLRYLPYMKALKENVDMGAFGKLTYAVASMRWNRGDEYYSSSSWRGTWKNDGGALMNQAIHVIDLLLWMFGPVKNVYGKIGRYLKKIEAEDTGMALLEFKNGAMGLVEASVCIYPENLEERLSIFGENGSAVIGGKALNKVEVWNFKDGKKIENMYDKRNLHSVLYDNVINSIEGKRQPLINAREGKKALELILAIYKSSKEGVPVALPLKDFSTEDMIGG